MSHKVPAALKKLRGNPGRRPIKPEVQPAPASVTDCPDWLDVEAQGEWRRLAPELIRLGLLTMADVAAFAVYCEAHATWRRYLALGAEVGPEKAVSLGYRAAADRAAERVVKVGARFGLDAVSRSNVTGKTDAPADEFEEWAKGKVLRGGKP